MPALVPQQEDSFSGFDHRGLVFGSAQLRQPGEIGRPLIPHDLGRETVDIAVFREHSVPQNLRGRGVDGSAEVEEER